MNFNTFSHGQIQSKLWLCEHLEPHLPQNAKIAILGSWYNLLAFILLTRDASRYQYILGIDIDPECKSIADRVTDAWMIGKDAKVENATADANEYDLSGFNLIINCSPEHMVSNDWFENLEYGTLVCIQSSNVTTVDDDIWMCVNANESLEDLAYKYPLSKYLFSGEKHFDYESGSYTRFMIIGIK